MNKANVLWWFFVLYLILQRVVTMSRECILQKIQFVLTVTLDNEYSSEENANVFSYFLSLKLGQRIWKVTKGLKWDGKPAIICDKQCIMFWFAGCESVTEMFLISCNILCYYIAFQLYSSKESFYWQKQWKHIAFNVWVFSFVYRSQVSLQI